MNGAFGWLPEPQFFVQAIWFCFALGVILLVRQLLLAWADAGDLSRLERNSRQARQEALRTLEDLGPRLRRDLRPGGVAARRVEHLLEQRAASPQPPQFQALAEIEMARAHRGLALPRTLAAILVLLGLCGAVSGLLEAVPGMVDILTSQTTLFEEGLVLKGQREELEARRRTAAEVDLTQELARQDALESDYASRRQQASVGLKTLGARLVPAFQASLSGILTTILLSVVLWGVENFQERRVLTPLEETTSTLIVPLLTPQDDLGSLQEAVEILTTSQEYFSQLTDRLLGQFDQVSAQLGVLYAVVDQFRHAAGSLGADRTALEEAHRAVLDTVHRFQELAEGLHTVACGQDQRHRQLVEGVQRLVAPLETLGDQLRLDKERDLVVLQGLLNHLREALDAHLDRMDQTQRLLSDERHQAGEAWQVQARARDEKLGEILEAVRQYLEGQSRSLGDLALSAEGQASALSALAPAAEDQKKALEAVCQEIGAARDEARSGTQATQEVGQGLARVEEVLRAGAQTLQKLPATQAEALAPVLARLQPGPAEVTEVRLPSENRGTQATEAALLEAVRQLQQTLRGRAESGPAGDPDGPRLGAVLERLEQRLEGLDQTRRVLHGSERWNRLALLCLPSCGAALVGMLYLVMPVVPLAITAGSAAVLTGALAWTMRRSPQ